MPRMNLRAKMLSLVAVFGIVASAAPVMAETLELPQPVQALERTPLLPPNLIRAIRSTPAPTRLSELMGQQRLYRVTASGKKQLASNIGLRRPLAGQPLQLIPIALNNYRRAVGGPADRFMSRPAALLTGVFPSEAVPTQKITIWGMKFDDNVNLTVSSVSTRKPLWPIGGITLRTYHTEEFGDQVEWTVPADTPPGDYWLSIWNANAPGSNPGLLRVKAPYPTTRYLVGQIDSLMLPHDYDGTGRGNGEVRFDFTTSAGRQGRELTRQHIAYGENGDGGFHVSGSVELVPGEIQLPILAIPRDPTDPAQRPEAVLFNFTGVEFDGAVTPYLQAVGAVAGAAIGAYFGQGSGLVSGFGTGGQLGNLVGGLIDDGNDSLGVHSNSFTRQDDFGAVFAGYPSTLKFDNTLGTDDGEGIRLSYRVFPVDAPRVNKVSVRLDAIDTSKIRYRLSGNTARPSFYVLVRAFDGPIGNEFPSNRKFRLTPEHSTSTSANIASPMLLNHIGAHDMPFVYVEITLWVYTGVHNMVGRTYSRMFLPQELMSNSDRHVEVKVGDTIAPPPGHRCDDPDIIRGTFGVHYTITIDR